MSSSPAASQRILYAEDDENDLFLMRRAFQKLGINQQLDNVPDGKAAMAYLYSESEEAPAPALILLDLSMPGRGGLDVLKWARSQPRLSAVPIVVLTSSNQDIDIHRAHLLGASGFFIKPGDPDELLRIVGAIRDCWLLDQPARADFVDIAAFRTHPSREPAH